MDRKKLKITFVYYDATEKSGNTYMVGLSIIAAVLRKAGYHISLLHINTYLPPKEVIRKAKEHERRRTTPSIRGA